MDFVKDDFNYTTVPISRNSTTSGSIYDEELIYKNYEIREQDRWLPLANVGRVMKNALPPQGKLSKESKMCVQECVSEFISFITSGAVDKCQAEKRKTLNGEDILYSLHSLGFENYAEVLKIYLAKFREHESLEADERREKDKRKRQLRKERKERERQSQQERITMVGDAANSIPDDLLLDSMGEENDLSEENELNPYDDDDRELDYSVLQDKPDIEEAYPEVNFSEAL